MNLQEKQALQDFLRELAQARAPNKDREAQAMILQAVQNLPDAPYLLVQRVLLQEQALNHAQQQIAALQQEINSGRHAGSGSFLDSASASQWGRSSYPAQHPAAMAQGASYRYQGNSRFNDAPSARPGLMNGGMGSFLGNMASVAAGVAAGSFLFHGIDQLLHPHDSEQGHNQQGLADTSGVHGAPDQPADDNVWSNDQLAQDAGINDIDIGGWAGNTGGGEESDYL